MAYPISLVMPNSKLPEVVYAENQPEYLPLPCIKDSDGVILTRWKLSWKERWLALWKGNIYLSVMTFNKPLQPLLIEVIPPKISKG